MVNRLLCTSVLALAIACTGCSSFKDTGRGSAPADAVSTQTPAVTAAASADTGAAPSPSQTGGPTAGPTSGEAVASVNGDVIPIEEFRRQAMETQSYFVERGLDPNSDDGQNRLRAVRRQVLDDMINQKLVEQAAPELGITVTDEEVQASLQKYIDSLGGEEAFQKSIEDAGTTRQDVMAMERASVIGQRVFEAVVGEVPTTAEFRHARHIQCETEEACTDALARLAAGETFDAVARAVSKDELTKNSGGDLDWVGRGTLPSRLAEDAIFSLEPGQRSGIVKTEYGYHIFEVTERDPNHAMTEEQRLDIREGEVLRWLAERRAQSSIEIYVDELKPFATPSPAA